MLFLATQYNFEDLLATPVGLIFAVLVVIPFYGVYSSRSRNQRPPHRRQYAVLIVSGLYTLAIPILATITFKEQLEEWAVLVLGGPSSIVLAAALWHETRSKLVAISPLLGLALAIGVSVLLAERWGQELFAAPVVWHLVVLPIVSKAKIDRWLCEKPGR